ncbi:hypothetical protein ACFQS1_19830 [Paractinoplanes rhizophilus]|uniref:Uncharacterized protein n=1 Tax=Paractinoplanes rhizophilus TaxID=1416877 RepID=A0ABW2HST6_9ACTN
MGDLDVPDGMALTCKPCGLRLDDNATMGVIAAHFEAEHGDAGIELELVVICPRCDKPMVYEGSFGRVDRFQCGPCHRTRTIRRSE